jgi:hypothetical protein
VRHVSASTGAEKYAYCQEMRAWRSDSKRGIEMALVSAKGKDPSTPVDIAKMQRRTQELCESKRQAMCDVYRTFQLLAWQSFGGDLFTRNALVHDRAWFSRSLFTSARDRLARS